MIGQYLPQTNENVFFETKQGPYRTNPRTQVSTREVHAETDRTRRLITPASSLDSNRGHSTRRGDEPCSKGLFTSKFFFCKIGIVAFSFVFDKYYPIMD